MNSIIRKTASAILALCLILACLPVFAQESALDGFFIDDSYYDGSKSSSGDGWFYYPDPGVLLIKGLRDAQIRICSPQISLLSAEENRLRSLMGPEEGILSVTAAKGSLLAIAPEEENSPLLQNGKTAVTADRLQLNLLEDSRIEILGGNRTSAASSWGGDGILADSIYAAGPEEGSAVLKIRGGQGLSCSGSAAARRPSALAASSSDPSFSVSGCILLQLSAGDSSAPCLAGSPYLAYDKELFTYSESKGSWAIPWEIRLVPENAAGEDAPQNSVPRSVSLSPARTDLAVKKTLLLKAEAEGGSLAALGTLTWTSSEPSVASVDQKGLVTARTPGTAVITVQSSTGLKAMSFITVKEAIASLKLSPTSLVLAAGESEGAVQIAAADKTGSAETDLQVAFDSDYIRSAWIDGGERLIVEPGDTAVSRTYVTVTDRISRRSVRLSVKIGNAADTVSTTMKTTDLCLVIGRSSVLKAAAACTSKAKPVKNSVEWQSLDTAIASVSAKGRVTGIAAGETTVTASVPSGFGHGSLDFSIKVVPALKKAAFYSPEGKRLTSINVKAGESLDLTRFLTEESLVWGPGAEGFTDYEISYSTTAKPSILTISSDGMVFCEGKGSGKVKLTVICGKQKKTTTLTVKVTE